MVSSTLLVSSLVLLSSVLVGSGARGSVSPAPAAGLQQEEQEEGKEGQPPGAPSKAPQEAGFQDASAPAPAPAPYRFEPGADVPPILIPRGERLEYRAYLDLGIVTTQVGTVVQTCDVTEQARSILMTQPGPSLGEAASIKLHASGQYALYELESTLETRMLPQEWPRIAYSSISKSSQTRRREVLLGAKAGKLVSSYRGDTSKGAPKGTRIWRPAREREIPEGTLDMLLAVFQARSLVRDEKSELIFPLIDSDKLWKLRLRRGERKRMELAQGKTFDVVEIVLEPEPYPGEEFEKKPHFEGVFGIQGSMHLWVEAHTGIAVRIQGILPVGGDDSLFKIGVDVVLDKYSGTPAEFAPVPAK